MKKHSTLPPVGTNPGNGRWAAYVEQAESDPDSWFEVGEYHRSIVSHLRSGKMAGFDPDKMEVTSRKADGGLSRIFIKVKA